jgi:hypothetical protein
MLPADASEAQRWLMAGTRCSRLAAAWARSIAGIVGGC